MAYRSIMVKDARSLHITNHQLLIEKNNINLEIPLEDISIILIEDQKALLSARLLGLLPQYDVAMVFCDDRHNPSAISLPLNSHYKQLQVFETQMNVKKPVLSQCWKKIINSKIINQIAVLKEIKADEFFIEQLNDHLKEIKSGDSSNREALAARTYFRALFGTNFVRKRSSMDPINVALNYGYTLILANISRLLAMYGFNTILGIHHCSYTNNLNLACDLMEPYRPIVDRYVHKEYDNMTYPLSTNFKKDLLGLLQNKFRIDTKRYTAVNAMEEMVLSYINVLKNNDSSKLICPQLLEDSNGTMAEDER